MCIFNLIDFYPKTDFAPEPQFEVLTLFPGKYTHMVNLKISEGLSHLCPQGQFPIYLRRKGGGMHFLILNTLEMYG